MNQIFLNDAVRCKGRSIKALCAILFVGLMASGCASNHYSEAVLLEPDQDNEVYQPVTRDGRSEGNSIYVTSDSKFSIEFSQIHPGWLHRNSLQNAQGAESEGSYAGFKDKELWVLVTIKSKSNTDPMELQSKQYFKVSNVKFKSEAFQNLSLDLAERNIFTHYADSAYTIQVDVYEVDGFDIKQEITAASQNPGISGIVSDTFKTGVNILGATLGDYVTSRLKNWSGDPLAVERLLLKQGAVLEFSGTIEVLRDDQLFNDKHPNKLVDVREFYLLDYYKSKMSKSLDAELPKNSVISDYEQHKTAIEAYRQGACIAAEGDCLRPDSMNLSFVRLKVVESQQETSFDAAVNSPEAITEALEDINHSIRQSALALSQKLDANLGDRRSVRSMAPQLVSLATLEEQGIGRAMPALNNQSTRIDDVVASIVAIDKQLAALSNTLIDQSDIADALRSQVARSQEITTAAKPVILEYQKLKTLKQLSDEHKKELIQLIKRQPD